MNVLLSIIIPFHNSVGKCERLLRTLSLYGDDDIEIVCINDGSTDCTSDVIFDFQLKAKSSVYFIDQQNKGPGGARNSGIEIAQGQYIWLVDSDDDIDLKAAVNFLRKISTKDYDFIDFDVRQGPKKINSMRLAEGAYVGAEVDKILFLQFGRIFSKIFSRKLFIEANIQYPEYCIYEDNPLGMIIPFYINSFYKSSLPLYLHQTEYYSVTRTQGGVRSAKYFDRMLTAAWGAKQAKRLVGDRPDLNSMIYSRFTILYVVNTIHLTKLPSKSWVEKTRVIRQYKTECTCLGLKANLKYVLRTAQSNSRKWKFLFTFLWAMSSCLPNQDKYFKSKRLEAWACEIGYPTSHSD